MKYLILMTLVFIAFGCRNQPQDPPNTRERAFNHQKVTFDETLIAAKKRLSESGPEGQKVLNLLDTLTKDGHIESIKSLPLGQKTASGHDGGIQQMRPASRYKIFLPATKDTGIMAQALAHELIHVQTEVEVDGMVAKDTAFAKRIETGGKLLTGQQSVAAQDYAAANDALMYIYFTEVRAYEQNERLHKEGLPDINSKVKELGVEGYVIANYTPKADGFGKISSVKLKEFLTDVMQPQDLFKKLSESDPFTP